jgi:hypothetical protein
MGAVLVNGRSTPVRALTQMTKVQKATERVTPAKPLGALRSVSGASAIAVFADGWDADGVASSDFEMSNFKSTSTCTMGCGFEFESLSPAHGQDFIPEQQFISCRGVKQSAWAKSCACESWITSPMINAMIDLMAIAGSRVSVLETIPRVIRPCHH